MSADEKRDKAPPVKGLEGVVVTASELSAIDGVAGRLTYRGMDIRDLAAHATFEETIYLLWFGELPTRAELASLSQQLAAERPIHHTVVELMESFPCVATPMDAMRTCVSALSACDEEAEDNSDEANVRKATRLTAKLPTIVTTYHRLLLNKEIIEPDPNLSHAANFLYMLKGQVPTPLEERTMDLALVLMADHGLNASTFAARVTAATLSDMYSAITSAIGTLKGPLHGGANRRAMEMLLGIGEEANIEGYVEEALTAKQRLMGFGHRVYKTIDPRAVELRGKVCELDSKWCRMATRMAEVVNEKKGLQPNVDFFSGPTLYTLGIPLELFTPVFAISRIAGWAAHVLEQHADNRLIRPRAQYVGPAMRPYVPIDIR